MGPGLRANGGENPKWCRGHRTRGQRDPRFPPVLGGHQSRPRKPLGEGSPPGGFPKRRLGLGKGPGDPGLPPPPGPRCRGAFLDSVPREHSSRFCSSSDSDYDDEDPPKFYIRIKPIQAPERVGSAATSAATEQLKASVGSLILPPSVGVSSVGARRETRVAPRSLPLPCFSWSRAQRDPCPSALCHGGIARRGRVGEGQRRPCALDPPLSSAGHHEEALLP